MIVARIEALEKEMQVLESKNNSEDIILKQKQVHALVGMIQDMKAEHSLMQAKNEESSNMLSAISWHSPDVEKMQIDS